MRSTASLPPVLLITAAFGQSADDAKVKAASTTLYARPDTKSRVVKPLPVGQRLRVSYSMTNAGGAWCGVDLADGGSGYVLCQSLEWPGGDRKAEPASAPPPAPETSRTQPAKPVVTTAQELRLHNYDPVFWFRRLGLSDEQGKRMEQSYREAQIAPCAATTRSLLARYGINDFASFNAAAENPSMAQFKKEFTAQFGICSGRLADFWAWFPSMLNPEQRARFEADRRLVPKGEGFIEAQYRLIF